jgi:lactoylglutathione lyase
MIVNAQLEHIGIPVRNLEMSKLLYCDLLGFQPFYEKNLNLPHMGRVIFAQKGTVRIELQEMVGDQWGRLPEGRIRGIFHLSFAVDSLDETVKQWNEAGLNLLVSPMDPGVGIAQEEKWRRAVFEGPDGESIELRGP